MKSKKYSPPIYDDIFYSAGEGFSSGFIQVKLNDKRGLVDEKTGKEITNMKYDTVSDFFFYQGYIWTEVSLDSKFGLIDASGKEIIPCKNDEILSIEGEGNENDKIMVRQGNREYFINKNGQEVK